MDFSLRQELHFRLSRWHHSSFGQFIFDSFLLLQAVRAAKMLAGSTDHDCTRKPKAFLSRARRAARSPNHGKELQHESLLGKHSTKQIIACLFVAPVPAPERRRVFSRSRVNVVARTDRLEHHDELNLYRCLSRDCRLWYGPCPSLCDAHGEVC